MQAHGRYWAEPDTRPVADPRRTINGLLASVPVHDGWPADTSAWSQDEVAQIAADLPRRAHLTSSDLRPGEALAEAIARLLSAAQADVSLPHPPAVCSSPATAEP